MAEATSGAPPMAASHEYTLEEWRAEAARRFGPPRDWSFICPACRHIQSPASIEAAGCDSDAPQLAPEVCYGRGTYKGKDCDWKAYGLFHGPVAVKFPDGKISYAFDFAPTKAEVIGNA